MLRFPRSPQTPPLPPALPPFHRFAFDDTELPLAQTQPEASVPLSDTGVLYLTTCLKELPQLLQQLQEDTAGPQAGAWSFSLMNKGLAIEHNGMKTISKSPGCDSVVDTPIMLVLEGVSEHEVLCGRAVTLEGFEVTAEKGCGCMSGNKQGAAAVTLDASYCNEGLSLVAQ